MNAPREVAAAHIAALAAARDVARAAAAGIDPPDLPAEVDRAAARAATVAGVPADRVRGLASAYLLAARVGGSAADPERAERWVTGWSRARSRTPEEVRQAAVDAVRFGERLHRALGIGAPGAGDAV